MCVRSATVVVWLCGLKIRLQTSLNPRLKLNFYVEYLKVYAKKLEEWCSTTTKHNSASRSRARQFLVFVDLSAYLLTFKYLPQKALKLLSENLM